MLPGARCDERRLKVVVLVFALAIAFAAAAAACATDDVDAATPANDGGAERDPDASDGGPHADPSVTDAAGVAARPRDASGPLDAQTDGSNAVDPCAGGSAGASSDADASDTAVSGYGAVRFELPDDVPIVGLTTTLHVPAEPPPSGTVFLWPGLQPAPGGANFSPIGNGVLQPVLTWGPTCAPNAPASPYASWWVSAQYVNTFGSQPGYIGCQGGPGMTVAVGDALTMTMTLAGTAWKQTVTDDQSGQSVTFDIDLQGQSQNYAEFVIEGYSQSPTTPVSFTSTVITFSKPSPASCRVVRRGATDSFAAPVAAPDGTRCCIGAITLKPQGL